MKNCCIALWIFATHFYFAQNSNTDVFQRITKEVNNFKVDTTTVPNDRLTAEIIKFRQTKGGFNINEAILFKISEDLSKGNLSKDEAQNMETFFTAGSGRKWLDNAVIRMYRDQFTLPEIKKLTRFYRSSTGQKLAQQSPVIMLQSLKAAEMIVGSLKEKMPKK